jgi:TPP-dependent pyruvate/acetoin dehydrogenase alpha subunit
VSDADIAVMEKTIEAEIDEAVAFAKASPFPTRDQMTSRVYALTRAE